MHSGWFSDYAAGRWGLYALAGGLGVVVLGLLGPPGRKPAPAPAVRAPAAGSTTGKTGPSPGKTALTLESVRARCQAVGIDAGAPPAPGKTAVTHPGFPRVAPPPTALGPASQGVFALRNKLNQIPARKLVHAPLLHKAARGFAERYAFYQHLVTDRAAAQRYLAQQEKLASGSPGGAEPARRPKPVTSLAEVAQRALQGKQLATLFFKELITGEAFRAYPDLPEAMLDYARFLLTFPQRTDKADAMAALHRLSDEHPTSPAAIEAKSFLASTEFARDQCAKVLFITKSLPTEALAPPVAGSERAVLRALAHQYAGLCELKAGNADAGIQRLGAAMLDSRAAGKADEALAAALGREAALQFARAYAVTGDVAHARKRFAPYGEPLVKLMSAVLVSQLLKEGNLRDAASLCPENPDGAPKAAVQP